MPTVPPPPLVPTEPAALEKNMTFRFPLGCRKKYNRPYDIRLIDKSRDVFCVIFNKSDCAGDAKCSMVQGNLRKIMVSLVQSPKCGYVQQIVNYKTSKSPYKALMFTNTHFPVAGIEAVFVYHTVKNDTQVGIDIIKKYPFSQQDDSMNGYKLCITTTVPGSLEDCVLDSMGRVNIASYDVTDHSCDKGQLVII